MELIFNALTPIMGLRLVGRQIGLPFQLYAVNGNSPEISITANAFHAIVADFFRIQIAAVTLAASDTFPVI